MQINAGFAMQTVPGSSRLRGSDCGGSAGTFLRAELPVHVVKHLLIYDSNTGYVTWAVKRGPMKAGDRAGTKSKAGYRVIRVQGIAFEEHRLCWALHYGKWPEALIDHRDGDVSNNAIANLREATPAINSQNRRKASKSNFLGVLGVCRSSGTKSSFRAQIKVCGKKLHLGSFKSASQAYEAYVEAKRRLHEGCTL